MISVADFLMNVLGTIDELCTLTVLESKIAKLSNRFQNTTKKLLGDDFLMISRGFSYLVLIKPNYELEWKFRQF